MSRTIDIIHCFHNAFRRDISQIDASVFNIARDGGDLNPSFSRLQIMSDILDTHARGEEAAVFHAVDKIAPFVITTYLKDHRELDVMTNGLEAIRKSPDPLTTARSTAVLASHLRIHLDKEDTYLYPFLRERTTDSEQESIINILSSKVNPERFPFLIQWLFSLTDIEDQVTVTKYWMSHMPPQFFASVKPLIQKTVAEKWGLLISQIPELSEKP